MAVNSTSGAQSCKRPSLVSWQRRQRSNWHYIQNLSSAVRVSVSIYSIPISCPNRALSLILQPLLFWGKVIPTWSVSCRRLTPGPGYFEALCSSNVSTSNCVWNPYLGLQFDIVNRRRSKRPKLGGSSRQASSCATVARTS